MKKMGERRVSSRQGAPLWVNPPRSSFFRGGKRHKGVDVVCEDGSVVYAPFAGKITGQARPYGNGNAIDNGVRLSGSGTRAERRASCKA